ncbi:MAG TPA: hypothetical protein VD767_09980 [Thermomicrobiales bacterium]|nr:hypothetical protein [Thermomicrobiales bacterium]
MSGKGSRVSGNPWRIREPYASSLTELWLVSAVTTVLAIRAYLALTGYPQVGGDTLHIAHMLWGGIGMAVAFGMIMLTAHGIWKPVATLVCGIGFGTFIDELGKFITQDNDYFFRPAIALMYGLMILLFVIARYIGARREPTEADHLFFAVQGLQWAAIGNLDHARQRVALKHLDASGNDTAFARAIREHLEAAGLIEDDQHSRLLVWRHKAERRYWQVVDSPGYTAIAVVLLALRAVQIVGAFILGTTNGWYDLTDGISFTEMGATMTAVVSGGFAVLGTVLILRGNRVRGLQAFVGSVLVSLLVGQFFAFTSVQILALGGLVADLVVLGMLRFALLAEHEPQQDQGGPGDEPDPFSGLGRFV